MTELPDAFINLTRETRVRALWFLQAPGLDVLGAVLKQPGKAWWCGYRFRYHRDQRAFDSDDVKSFHEAELQDEAVVESVVKALDSAFTLIAKLKDATWERLDVNGNGEDASEMLLAKRYAHAKPAGELDNAANVDVTKANPHGK